MDWKLFGDFSIQDSRKRREDGGGEGFSFFELEEASPPWQVLSPLGRIPSVPSLRLPRSVFGGIPPFFPHFPR